MFIFTAFSKSSAVFLAKTTSSEVMAIAVINFKILITDPLTVNELKEINFSGDNMDFIINLCMPGIRPPLRF